MVYEYDYNNNPHCLRCEGHPIIVGVNAHNHVHNTLTSLKRTLKFATPKERELLLKTFA